MLRDLALVLPRIDHLGQIPTVELLDWATGGPVPASLGVIVQEKQQNRS